MNCIGIDVSKQTLVAYDGKKERVFPNSKGLAELVSFLGRRGKDIALVFEPTSTYSRRLETLCRKQGIRCCYLNPRIIPHLREVVQERSKTDRSDAELLYQYGQEKAKTQARLLRQDSLVHALSAILSCYKAAQKARVTCQGVLEALRHDPDTLPELLTEVKEQIAHLKAWEKKELNRAEAIIQQNPQASQALDRLLYITGGGR